MRLVITLLFVLGTAGCNSSGSPEPAREPPPPTPPPPPVNTAPTIAGTPIVETTAGQPYSFTPIANDADGDTLSFFIDNQPAWAAFDPDTGGLSGTPQSTDIGTSVNVTISVSDASVVVSLPAFDLDVLPVPAGSAIVSWDIPTTNADGTDLDDLAGFTVHYGQSSANYTETAVINDATATSAEIGDLDPGTWYFAVTAFDGADNHSELSAEVSKVVTP